MRALVISHSPRMVCICCLIATTFTAFAPLQAQEGTPATKKRADTPTQNTEKQVEAARQKLADALKVKKYGDRQEALLDAAKAFDACLELDFSDEIMRHRVMREAGNAYYELAKTDWPYDMWNGAGTGERGPWRPDEARKNYARAKVLFSKAVEYWSAKLGEWPKDPEEAQSKAVSAAVGFVELGAAETENTRCSLGLASSLPSDDSRRPAATKEALAEFNRVFDTYSNFMVGLYAGGHAAKVHFELGDYESAIKTNEQVLDLIDHVVSSSPSFTEDLRGRVGEHLMRCWIHPKVAKPELAIEFAEAWLDREPDHKRKKDPWIPFFRTQLAHAYFLRWKSAAEDTRKDDDRKAAREHAEWVIERYPGDLTSRMVLAALDAAGE
jgi:tetratricopeptide (TPR) repeat protein